MADPVLMMTGAISLTKQLLDLASLSKDATAKGIIADLQIQLADLKIRFADLMNENQLLKVSLKAAESGGQDLIFKDDLYFKPNDDGPFCTACFDTDKKLVRVTEQKGPQSLFFKYQCNVCGGHYGG